jgi:hypothetical protein
MSRLRQSRQHAADGAFHASVWFFSREAAYSTYAVVLKVGQGLVLVKSVAC